MKNHRIVLLMCFMLIIMNLNAITDLFNIKSHHGNMDLAVRYSYWEPDIEMRYIESDYIKSETLGEAVFDVKGYIEYNSYSIFNIDYILPLKRTPYMDNIIEFNKKRLQLLKA